MKTGAVAFLDLLGFKEIWRYKEEKEILKLVKDAVEVIERKYEVPSPDKGWPVAPPPKLTILSDPIVITMDSDDPRCILLMANILYHVMKHFHDKEVFIRGAIGWGEYAIDCNTFLGPAISDVAAWYEQADWIGIISTPKTNYILEPFSSFKAKSNGYNFNMFLKYDVPGKNGDSYHLFAYNWPCYLQSSFSEMPSDGKSKARAHMEWLFSQQNAFDASVLKKYENTLKFVDYTVNFMRPI